MATNLVAYSKNTPDKTLECQQSAINEGNLIRRSWSRNVNGINYTYTQLIKLPETVTTKELVSYQAQQLATMAKVLYDNIGNIGYPKATWLKPRSSRTPTTRCTITVTSLPLTPTILTT